MSYRQFIWGLSNGIIVLAASGTFWLALAAFQSPRPLALLLAAPIALCFLALLYAAIRLRKKSHGFKRSELKTADQATQVRTRKIIRGIRWINLLQLFLVWLSSLIAYVIGRPDLLWPFIALVVSLHFIPLAKLFRVPLYHATAAAGTLVSLIAISNLAHPYTPQLLGIGMALTTWLSAVYLLKNADQIATQSTPNN